MIQDPTIRRVERAVDEILTFHQLKIANEMHLAQALLTEKSVARVVGFFDQHMQTVLIDDLGVAIDADAVNRLDFRRCW